MGFAIEDERLEKYSEEPGVTEVTMPEGVTVIAGYFDRYRYYHGGHYGAFEDCRKLQIVTIPRGVLEIGSRTFSGCSSLTSVTIPEGVKEIGGGAFEGCTNLANVTIPGSVKEIERESFKNCTSLTNVDIPEGVKEIGGGAFEGCTNLINVVIPESMRGMGDYAFRNCRNLQCVSLPTSLKRLDEAAFWGDLHKPDGEKIHHVASAYMQVEYYGYETREAHGMLFDKNYSVQMDHEIKYKVLWAHYRQVPEEAEITAYVKKNFSKMFPFAIEHDDVETVKFVCEQGALLTSRNIEKMLTAALEHEKKSANGKEKGKKSAEIVAMLTEYCGTIAQKASLAQLHKLFDLANEHNLVELKMQIMHIKHERFPKDEQRENDFSLD